MTSFSKHHRLLGSLAAVGAVAPLLGAAAQTGAAGTPGGQTASNAPALMLAQPMKTVKGPHAADTVVSPGSVTHYPYPGDIPTDPAAIDAAVKTDMISRKGVGLRSDEAYVDPSTSTPSRRPDVW